MLLLMLLREIELLLLEMVGIVVTPVVVVLAVMLSGDPRLLVLGPTTVVARIGTKEAVNAEIEGGGGDDGGGATGPVIPEIR